MFKKTLKVLSLVAILGLSANANDLLADISKGAISDSSLGVKVLNPEQMSEVRGGYILSSVLQYNGMAFVLAIPHPITELGVDTSNLSSHGLCPLGQLQCYANPTTREHIDRNQGRYVDYISALGGRTAKDHVLLYGIKNTNVGNGVMAPTTHVYAVKNEYLYMPEYWFDNEVTNSFQLEYNQVLREIKQAVGTDLLRMAR
ncbi:hypothetical protein AVANS_1646 [Campylobacter sp. RM5004]|uniref:hypothetical protein n=1 Tax=Campylobacter sp. RM5004 TaxID=1660078 RepID=UPI001EFBF584|nr:hypothetical protein [Campylobacter sp. RM5004]ULO02252.1 hypothetical protein AVANS_1646 [Campylobacter sp. RM5004]